MAKKASWNPLAFVPNQVTFWTLLIYIAVFVVLLWSHHTVPPAPSNAVPAEGLNLTQAWLDLDFITDGFHPVGTRRNDIVRSYLIRRIDEILEGNGVEYEKHRQLPNNTVVAAAKEGKAVQVFLDDRSNITFSGDWAVAQPYSYYVESSNIIVYIPGKADEGQPWKPDQKYSGPGGILVNAHSDAHFDSVSTGYGATDNGIGVVSVLQLISYFTSSKKRQPEHGIVALLNNGEENGLLGAHAFLQHPLSQFTHTFLNLEGAGAGGRATLFRSTDAEVTKFYAQSSKPYGSVVSADGFKQGFIRSGTDYSVFADAFGMRGLDVAFFEPRSRYHTSQDSARETTPDSLWHMLSASISTMEGLTKYDGDDFSGKVNRDGKLDVKKGSNAVYFDLFGNALAVLRLNTLFALSVSLLVVGPVLLILLEVILVKTDKFYPFSRKAYLHSAEDDEAVQLHGLRGFFRWPIAFIIATAAVVALAFLVTKINPFIVYGSEYVVWSMMLSAWTAIAWFILAGGDRIRPTALQRMFGLTWSYIISWILLVAVTVGENNFKIGAGYFAVIYNAAVFVSLLISYLELFALPKKQKYVEHVLGVTAETDAGSTRPGSRSSRTLLNQSRERPASVAAASEAANDEEGDAEAEATESTSLLRGRGRRAGQGTFTRFGKRRQHPEDDGMDESGDHLLDKAYGDEQAWSSSLPGWTWILQFLILAPINLILVGQIALLITSAIHQTPSDGNPVLPVYLIIAALTVLLLLPLSPFLHRLSYYIPTLLLLAFVGCLVYSLVAFPFGREARMKYYFQQSVDLDTGSSNVTLYGLDGYVQDIIDQLPSVAGKDVRCGKDSDIPTLRQGLQTCVYEGLMPQVVPSHGKHAAVAPYGNKSKIPEYDGWLQYKASVSKSDDRSASFELQGKRTKQCRLLFENPVSSLTVADSASNALFPVVSDGGSYVLRMMSRDWDKNFRVNVTFADGKAAGQKGKAACLWEESEAGEIPALDEIKRFAPAWSAVTKAAEGLVVGWKEFEL